MREARPKSADTGVALQSSRALPLQARWHSRESLARRPPTRCRMVVAQGAESLPPAVENSGQTGGSCEGARGDPGWVAVKAHRCTGVARPQGPA